jgi:hypothetical protein
MYPSEQIMFLPLLIVDVSMEHSHRRTEVTEDDATSSDEVGKPGTPRHRLVGFLLAKALAPLRLVGAR